MSERRVVILILLLAAGGSTARAQFSGSISTGMESSSNIQSLDTSSPDRIFLPALQLNYDWRAAATSRISFGVGLAPNLYSITPALSYTATTLSATGLFYLSNGDAIRAESQSSTESMSAPARVSIPTQGEAQSAAAAGATETAPRQTTKAEQEDNSSSQDEASSKSDALVEHAVEGLYSLSGRLDSLENLGKGLSKSQRERLSDLRDSVSEILTTDADLLDSIGYSESAADVIVSELRALRPAVVAVSPKEHAALDAIIKDLSSAKPSSDFLATPTAPAAAIAAIPTSGQQPAEMPRPSRGTTHEEESEASTPAPAIMEINSSTRLRDFAASDVQIREDADDSGATTLATTLSIPLSYSVHSGHVAANASDSLLYGIGTNGVTGNPNDSKIFSLGVALEVTPGSGFSTRLGFDHTESQYPFDSVYTNAENRFRLGVRLGLGARAALFGEFGYGFKRYENPLEALTGKSVASSFTQASYGLGLLGWLGDRWVLGALFMVNSNPNLRAYVTQGLNAKRRLAPQLADDEYTYDLARIAGFSASRIFWDLDLNIDLNYEHRTYGSASRKILKKFFSVGGQTENGLFPSVSLSKMWAFDERLASVFTSFTLQAALNYSSVASSDPTYAYTDSEFTLNGSLGF